MIVIIVDQFSCLHIRIDPGYKISNTLIKEKCFIFKVFKKFKNNALTLEENNAENYNKLLWNQKDRGTKPWKKVKEDLK